jgi:hypothetical protein
MADTLISSPFVAARVSVAMTRWRRRAESACRPASIGPGGRLCADALAVALFVLAVMRRPPWR